MKLMVLLVICACCLHLAFSKSDPATNRESKHKVSTKQNSLSTTPKPETQYHTIQQQQLQYQPNYQQQYQQQPALQRPLQAQVVQAQHVAIPQQQIAQLQYQAQTQPQPQLVQRAFLVPQHPGQPAGAAMIIIAAQPAYVPAGIVHGGATQQLLGYFQNNPQARYQFLHGNYQPQQVQPAIQQPAHTIGNYVVAVPAQYQPNIVAVPVHRPQVAHLAQAQIQAQDAPAASSEGSQQPTPLQLAEIAQIASQQYTRINPATQQQEHPAQYQYQQEARAQQQPAVPVRSLPPIFTGFENFSPEQQEKIKAQLSAHFGAPLQALPADRVPLVHAQAQAQAQAQGNQYSSKYQTLQQGLNSDEFIPSEQVKTDASSPNVSSNKSAHYTNV